MIVFVDKKHNATQQNAYKTEQYKGVHSVTSFDAFSMMNHKLGKCNFTEVHRIVFFVCVFSFVLTSFICVVI